MNLNNWVLGLSGDDENQVFFKVYANSESVVMLHWQHVVGNEGTCQY